MNPIEKLAELEHEQWMTWSKSLISQILDDIDPYNVAEIRNRILVKHQSWFKLWKPYTELTEEEKEKDREWAEKVYDVVPIKCPVWQCGGTMKLKDDEQTPTLICENCGAIYGFIKFEKETK